MTAIAAALEKAGYDTGLSHLSAEYERLSRKYKCDPAKIRNGMFLLIREDRACTVAATDLVIKTILGEGPNINDGHMPLAQSQNRAGRTPLDTLNEHARAPTPRSAVESQAALNAGRVVSLTVLDTFRLSDGTPLGDVKMSSIPRLKSKFKRDAALLDLISKYGQSGDPFATVRDVVPLGEIQRMIQKASEIGDEQN